MKIEVEIDAAAYVHLVAMGEPLGLTIADLVEVAIYNVIALWLRERTDPIPLDADDGMAGAR